jgi:hypothetical protein
MTTTQPPQTIAQLRQRANDSEHSAHWFAPSTLRFWNSRIGYSVYPGASHTFFVTSERMREERRYTVRACDASGEILTVGDFGAFATRSAAHRAAGTLATFKHADYPHNPGMLYDCQACAWQLPN